MVMSTPAGRVRSNCLNERTAHQLQVDAHVRAPRRLRQVGKVLHQVVDAGDRQHGHRLGRVAGGRNARDVPAR